MILQGKRSVLFVCTGNICRSPAAEGVFRKLAADTGLDGYIVADSAGTTDYHTGQPPDSRMQSAARARGYDLSRLRARQVEYEDFGRFDLVVAMDREHRDALAQLAPAAGAEKIRLMMEFARRSDYTEVPDPYYGGPAGFELVLDLIEDAAAGLLATLAAELDDVRS